MNIGAAAGERLELTQEQKILKVIGLLEGRKFSRESQQYEFCIGWIRVFPEAVDPTLRPKLIEAIKNAFDVTEVEIYAAVEGVEVRKAPEKRNLSYDERFEKIIPKGDNWFQWYTEYTRYNESPMSFHVFSSLCVLAAGVGRKVWLPFGHTNIYPNYCVILVGPTGLVKKTYAGDRAHDLVRDSALCPIMTDQFTPSRFVTHMVETGGRQFIYSGELSNTINREKFNENMIPTLLRILDCPPVYQNETHARKNEVVDAPTIVFLGATAPELIVQKMPSSALTGGFVNRFIWINEDDTDRVFPIPGVGEYGKEILDTVKKVAKITGEMRWDPKAFSLYEEWYRERKDRLRAIEDFATIKAIQRGDIHMLKTTILVNLVMEDALEIQERSVELAVKLIDYAEQKTPGLVKSLAQDQKTQDTDFVLDVITRMGGVVTHSDLLRRIGWKTGGTQGLKAYVKTLEDQGSISVRKRGVATIYVLAEQEKK